MARSGCPNQDLLLASVNVHFGTGSKKLNLNLRSKASVLVPLVQVNRGLIVFETVAHCTEWFSPP